VAEALDAIDYGGGPIAPQPARMARDEASGTVERLVECPQFALDRRSLAEPASIGGDDRCHFLAVLAGSLAVAGDPSGEPLRTGGTILLPAACGGVRVTPQQPAVVLDCYLP
jgi:mannose-6-phosphate isomerase